MGSQWSERVLFPKLVASLEGSIYLYRVTLLFIIQVRSSRSYNNILQKQSITILTPETLSKAVAPILVSLSRDSVPNVRINAAKALKLVIPALKDKSVDVLLSFVSIN